MPDFYIFDFDGTLIDSSEEILSSITLACKQENIEIKNLDKTIIGQPISIILKNILKNTDYEIKEKIAKNFREIYDNIEFSNIKEIKGAGNFLNTLKTKNKNMYLLTNKPLIPTKKILKILNWNDFFDDIYTIDRYNPAKNKTEMLKLLISENSIEKENCIYIGDTTEDMDAAKDCNIIKIAAMWGYEKNKELLIHKADFSLEKLDVEDLDYLIEDLCKYFAKTRLKLEMPS